MMIHLSSRFAWHENSWNGCVRHHPHLNVSCIASQLICEVDDNFGEISQ